MTGEKIHRFALGVFRVLSRDVHPGRATLTIRMEQARNSHAGPATDGVEPWVGALLHNGLVGVFRTTVAGEIRFANAALVRLLEAEDHTQVMCAGAAHWYREPGDRARLLAVLRRDGAVQGFEVALTTTVGTTRHVLVSAKQIGDEITGVMMDVSDRKRAEVSLRRSEDRYRRLVESMREAYLATGPDGLVVAANPAAAVLLGYRSVGDLLGTEAIRVYADPADRDAIFRQLRLRGYAENFEVTLVREDGVTRVPVLGSAVLRRDAEGTLLVESILSDITEWRRTEAALRESEARYRAAEQQLRNIVEHSTNVFYAHTTEHVLTYLSPQVHALLDYEPEEALIRWTELLTDNPVNAFGVVSTDLAIATGTPQPPYELELRGKHGRVVWVEVHEAPVVRDGRTVEIVGSLTDITKRKEAEATLRRSEESYRHLVEHATHGIYRSTPEGRFLAVNPALVQMLGYESDTELLGTDVRDVYASPEERDALITSHQGAARILGVEVRWKRKDGRLLTVRLSGRPVHTEAGRLDCFEMIAEDVTEQRALEGQLRQAQKMEAIGQLTGGIAHDFNNELSVIILNAQLVADALEQGAEVRVEDVRDIEDAAKRSAAMTRQLLGFSRQADLTLAPTDVARVATQLSGALRRLVPENIELRLVADEAVPAVRADSGAVEQMLLNLITNARDAMPQGGRLAVVVKALERAGPSGRPHVCVSVCDTGVGMDEATKSRIFEPFFTTKPVGVGTGLGLAMVYGLMRQHDGFVDVESAPGLGTTVRLCFPAAEEAALAPARAESRPSVLRGTETILLVEDEDALRRATRRALERHGYDVVTAANGAEALRVLRDRSGQIALVISDLVMPVMSGVQLYHALRREYGPVPFILASGYAGRDAEERRALDPSLPFLLKPWSLGDLLKQVRQSLDSRVKRD
jgi:PAS domain S-box-containing protein